MTTDHAATATRLGVDQEWRADAACAGRPEVMDPTGDQIAAAKRAGTERDLWRPAREICWACPVYGPCRAWVLSLPKGGDVSGVCGGLTEDERAKARRRASGLKSAATIRALRAGDPVPDGMLRCSRCGRDGDDEDFVRDKRNTGRRGRASWCRECEAQWRRDRWARGRG